LKAKLLISFIIKRKVLHKLSQDNKIDDMIASLSYPNKNNGSEDIIWLAPILMQKNFKHFRFG